MYKNVKKKIERGVAFPTCISVNNIVCHFSPLVSDETVMEAGDVLNMWAFFLKKFFFFKFCIEILLLCLVLFCLVCNDFVGFFVYV